MPIYMYQCQDIRCGKVFEKFYKSYKVGKNYDEDLCPDCKNISKKLVVHSSNPILMGRGWAKDGYQKPTSTR